MYVCDVCMYVCNVMYVCMYVMYVSTLCSVALIIIVQTVTSKARVQWSESMCVRNEVICPVCMYVM